MRQNNRIQHTEPSGKINRPAKQSIRLQFDKNPFPVEDVCRDKIYRYKA